MERKHHEENRPTEDPTKQLAARDGIQDAEIDLSDLREQSDKGGWVGASIYRPSMRAVSIRLPMSDLTPVQDLAAMRSFSGRVDATDAQRRNWLVNGAGYGPLVDVNEDLSASPPHDPITG